MRKLYLSKSIVVEAYRFVNNSIPDWIKQLILRNRIRIFSGLNQIKIYNNEGECVGTANIGDWIYIEIKTGKLWIRTNEDFQKEFERIITE